MANSSEVFIKKIAQQFEKFIESNKLLSNMITSPDSKDAWEDNYHLIDSTWISAWKENICFENLEKSDYGGNYNTLCSNIESSIKSKTQEKLNNKEIYYKIDSKNVIDPMKEFYLVSDDVWKLLDKENENVNYNGKVSILKGNKKIITKFDENNYSVKYLADKNFFDEFIIVFNPPENQFKSKILEDVKNKEINQWKIDVDFQNNIQQFSINKYGVPFDIKQKSITFQENIINDSKDVSFSKFTFPSPLDETISSISILINFPIDRENFGIIPNYKKTSNISSAIKCLSMIEPLANYFMSIINEYKIFNVFKSNSLIMLTKKMFFYFWNNKVVLFDPKNFFECYKVELPEKKNGEKININLDEEQDPIPPLKLLIEYINKKLNNMDNNINFNFNNIKESFTKESYYPKFEEIISENNSIIAQNFFGLILKTIKCQHCEKTFKKLEKLKIIDIDFISIINHWNRSDEDDSIIGKNIDSFLEFYFLKEIAYMYNCPKCKNKTQIKKGTDTYEFCKTCKGNITNPYLMQKCDCGKKAKIIERKILYYPAYLIIRLNIGEFESSNGFNKLTSDMQNLNIGYDKIVNLKEYCSNKIRNYSSISNYEYVLMNMIKYSKNNGEIKFISYCKSLFGINDGPWIFFDYGKKPIVRDYKNKDSFPYILFYKLKKKKKKINNNYYNI